MKPTEAAALLTICAAYDNRKPDADAAKAWALALDDLRFEDCREAVVLYYRASRVWIMPVDVREGVTEVRRRRWNAFVAQYPDQYVLPPARFTEDADAEMRWLREITERVRDGEVLSPAELDDDGELKPRDVSSLGQIGRSVPRA